MIIYTEDMKVVPAKDLLTAFADFTGLTFAPEALDDRFVQARCRINSRGRMPNHMSFDKGMTQRESAMLQAIFQPYENMLEVWIKHYGVKVALDDHPAALRRRERLMRTRRRLSLADRVFGWSKRAADRGWADDGWERDADSMPPALNSTQSR